MWRLPAMSGAEHPVSFAPTLVSAVRLPYGVHW
jgi:hypothetical protein